MSSAHPLLLQTIVARVLHDLKSVPTIPESVTMCAEQDMTTHLSKLSFPCRRWFGTRRRLECWKRHGAKAYFRKIAERHYVRSFRAICSHRLERADGVDSSQLIPLAVASANVNTLYPKQKLTSYGRVGFELMYQKVQALELAFDECECHVVGVQEGRAKSCGVREGVKCRVLHSAADQNGNAGVQIWLHRSLSSEIRAWAVVSERLLWAACSFLGGQCAVFVAAQSPIDTSTGAVRILFWDCLEHTMTQLRLMFPAFEVIVLIDGNARLGSVVSPSIGGCDCAKESPNGMTLRCMCERFNTEITNSFFLLGRLGYQVVAHALDWSMCSVRVFF